MAVVGKASNQRWLWYAVGHAINQALAFVFGQCKDSIFQQPKTLLAPFGIQHHYTDGWGAYERHLDAGQHETGIRHTQKIERKNLNLGTRAKRLARRQCR